MLLEEERPGLSGHGTLQEAGAAHLVASVLVFGSMLAVPATVSITSASAGTRTAISSGPPTFANTSRSLPTARAFPVRSLSISTIYPETCSCTSRETSPASVSRLKLPQAQFSNPRFRGFGLVCCHTGENCAEWRTIAIPHSCANLATPPISLDRDSLCNIAIAQVDHRS